MKKGNVFWGMFLLLGAAFILATQFTDFIEVGFWTIIGTLLCMAAIIERLIHLSFSGIVIPAAILYVLYQTPLDLPYVNPWILLTAALLATIGLSQILPRGLRWRKYKSDKYQYHIKAGAKDVQEQSGENLVVTSRFNGVSRYIHSDNLRSLNLHCSFGGMEIYCDKVVPSPDGAVIELSCSFGGIELYVPRNWFIEDHVNCSFGNVEHKKRYENRNPDDIHVIVTGQVSFGGVDIHYI